MKYNIIALESDDLIRNKLKWELSDKTIVNADVIELLKESGLVPTVPILNRVGLYYNRIQKVSWSEFEFNGEWYAVEQDVGMFQHLLELANNMESLISESKLNQIENLFKNNPKIFDSNMGKRIRGQRAAHEWRAFLRRVELAEIKATKQGANNGG